MDLKKLMAGALAAISIFAGAVGATASSSVKSNVTVDTSDTHTYKVYQIFVGDTEGSSLTSVQWGASAPSGKSGYVTHDDLTAIETISTLSTDAEKLKGTDSVAGLTSYVDLDKSVGTVSATSPISVEEGYYLFKDNDTLTGSDTYTLYIAKAVLGADIKIERKAANAVPTVTKTVAEKDTYANGADASIGDTINYKVVATMADNLSAYSIYKLQMKDTPSAGLTLNKDSVKVTMGTTDVSDKFTKTNDGTAIVVSCDDILKIEGVSKDSVFTFTYTGTLNENAVTGSAGNANSAVLSYSNNPNDTTATESKSSVSDSVNAYTYKLVVNELDEKTPAQALEGVGLTLYKKQADGSYIAVGTEKTGMTTFEWDGLDAADYKLSETTSPVGYKTMADKEFSITSTIDADGNLTKLESNLEGATVTLADGKVETSIVNATKVALPVTGSAAIAVLAFAAAAVCGTAVVLKKKGKEDY